MINKADIKQEIQRLIDKYNKVVEEGRFRKYNEEMTKKDFILPLFRTLGWNSEDSSEVTAEEKISKKRVGGFYLPPALINFTRCFLSIKRCMSLTQKQVVKSLNVR